MEHAEVSRGARIPLVAAGRPLSNEVRASLEAVREAEEAARLRARRETVRTRIWFATVLATVGVAALAFGPRLARGRHARSQAAAVATASAPAAPEALAPASNTPVAAVAIAEAPDTAASGPALPDTSATAVTPLAAQPAGRAAAGAEADEGCDTSLIRRAPWRLSAQACARAFGSDPTNASLALAIAHAEHAHGSATEAAVWARRALELDPSIAEAYVLIARGDLKSNRPEDARAAYRRYLQLAPRGWHKAEARAAINKDR
jgi:hypothetical protein